MGRTFSQMRHHARPFAVCQRARHAALLLYRKGIKLRPGTLVDATIIDAPSSTKNKAKARAPEMSSTKKGYPQVPRRRRRTGRACRHPTTQERQAVEAFERWGDRSQRGATRLEIPWPRHLANVERIPPPKPRRDEDALREAAGAEPHGTRLRPSGC